MFDPYAYLNVSDNTENSVEKKEEEYGPFVQNRDKLVTYLRDTRELMGKECESLKKHLDANPNGYKAKEFDQKIKGWSNIMIGVDIITKLYKV